MYSIGEFSKINRVTPKTLRHYDEIGILSPSYVDEWTGYRYYDAGRLPVIARILTLKNFGFSLQEIKEILNDNSILGNKLEERAKNLSRSISEDQQKLNKVNTLLSQIQGESAMCMKPKIITLPEVIVASMRTTVPSYDTYFNIVPKMGEYMKSVGAVFRTPAYCFTIYHDGEYRESDIGVEICEAVLAPCKESQKIKFKTVPAVPIAIAINHLGPYSTLRESYNALFTWIDENGYKQDGPPRESYIDGIWNKSNESEWLTEIQLPVVKKEKLGETL